MAKLVFGMNQSLDGYVDYDKFAPGPLLFRHFIEQAKTNTGSIYGRGLYELMAYWDEDQPDWGEDERAFAVAWRKPHKWVVSNSLKTVGPNASLLGPDLAAEIHKLKAEHQGTIEVGGPVLAKSLTELGLIDEYVIYLHPVVLGSGDPFFAGSRPRLRLASSERIAEGIMQLTYVPAEK
ncbi:MAG: dihydrofolate reductase family protein [Devosia sp.]